MEKTKKTNYVMTEARKAALAKAIEASRVKKQLNAIQPAPVTNEVINAKLDSLISHVVKLTDQLEFIVNNTPLKLNTDFLK